MPIINPQEDEKRFRLWMDQHQTTIFIHQFYYHICRMIIYWDYDRIKYTGLFQYAVNK